jgi:glutamyl-tRNA reductase
MSFIVIGTNHKHGPLELRERISFSGRKMKDALDFLKERKLLKGAVILSTCNRVEIYASAVSLDEAEKEIKGFISGYHEIARERLDPYLYVYKEKAAARHLFEVVSGLDSQVPGETQIMGQVSAALEQADRIGFADKFLIRIFDSAVSFSKETRKNTKISEGKVSIGSVSMDFIRERFGALKNKKILIIGMGKVTGLILKYLEKEGPNVIFISNRTYEKAKKSAEQIGASAVGFDDLKRHLNEADIVISATASPHFIIRKETLDGINNRLFIIDLALPRDVDPGVKELENVRLYSLEDLDGVIKKNIGGKLEEAEKIKKAAEIEVNELWRNIIKSEPEPALSR